MMIRDNKHLIGLEHIHMEQMLLKLNVNIKKTYYLKHKNDKTLMLMKIKLNAIKIGHIFQIVHTEY